jgi:hypothetical protein
MHSLTRALSKLTLVSLLAISAGGMGASNAAASDMTISQLDYEQYAVDGADFYWLRSKGRDKFGCAKKTQLLRRDLFGESTKVVATFSTGCAADVEVGWPEAGGGRVAVERYTERFDGFESKIFSMNRNGGEKRVLGSGSMRGDFAGENPAAACGRSFHLISGAPSGEFVVSGLTKTSGAKGCHGAHKGTNVTYTAIASNGSKRKVYSYDGKLSLQSYFLPLSSVQLNGDHAALVKAGTRRVLSSNLKTGLITQLRPDVAPWKKAANPLIETSVGPLGQVLVNAPNPKPHDYSGYMATELFASSEDQSNVVLTALAGSSRFCGSRVIAEGYTSDDSPVDPLVELDPQTLAVKNVIAQVVAGSEIEGCSSSAVTLSSENNDGKAVLHAVVL